MWSSKTLVVSVTSARLYHNRSLHKLLVSILDIPTSLVVRKPLNLSYAKKVSPFSSSFNLLRLFSPSHFIFLSINFSYGFLPLAFLHCDIYYMLLQSHWMLLISTLSVSEGLLSVMCCQDSFLYLFTGYNMPLDMQPYAFLDNIHKHFCARLQLCFVFPTSLPMSISLFFALSLLQVMSHLPSLHQIF